MGLNPGGNEYVKCFDKAVHMHVTPASTRVMLVCLYQIGAEMCEMYWKHEYYMFSDIREFKTKDKRTELVHGLSDVPYGHGGPLLPDYSFWRTILLPLQTKIRNMQENWFIWKELWFQKEEMNFGRGMDSWTRSRKVISIKYWAHSKTEDDPIRQPPRNRKLFIL